MDLKHGEQRSYSGYESKHRDGSSAYSAPLVKDRVGVLLDQNDQIIYEAETKGLVNQWRLKNSKYGRMAFKDVKTGEIRF